MQFLSEEHKRAAKKAMKLLEHMDRTEKGLRDRLQQDGFSQDGHRGSHGSMWSPMDILDD